MAAGIPKDDGGPRTHALLIGVGAYPSLDIAPIPGSATGALELASWFRHEYDNPTAPLGSLEVLVSPAPETTEHKVARPTAGAIGAAISDWLARARTHPDNIAVFYFSGHGGGEPASGDQLLIPDDAGGERLGEVVSVEQIIKRLDECAAERQVLLIDTSWVKIAPTGFTYATTGGEVRIERPLRRGVFRAAGPGGHAFGPPDGISYFTQALLDILRGPATAPVSLQRLASYLPSLTANLTKRAGVEQTPRCETIGDFDLHLPPPMPSVQAAAPKAAKKAATPRPRKKAAAKASAPQPPTNQGAGPDPTPPNPPPPTPTPAPAQPSPRPDLDFLDDDAELETDTLGRATPAVILARRLHMIWRNLNVMGDRGRSDSRASFVVHLDAPWGGGKTTFANFVARVLNPYGFGGRPAGFLTSRCGEAVNLSAAFVRDPPPAGEAPEPLEPDAARPWIIVPFNAWRMEHCTPPWWSFYQVMRASCFRAIRTEGDRPAALTRDGGRVVPPWWERYGRWSYLWIRELAWRLLTPKLVFPAIGLGLSVLVFVGMGLAHWITLGGKDDDLKVVFDPTSPVGLAMLGLTGLTVVGGVVSLIVESLAPGVDPLAERLGLGHSDPYERFQRHFQHTMARVRRPVLVIVDDLDRCRPEMVVDLVRGMQTLLRSPRVVFLILGDRDWIERAFEARNAEMSKVGGAAEQTLGARFVEKAIQMSFLLPGMGEKDQTEYVSRLLRRAPAEPDSTQALSVRLREQVRQQASASTVFDAQALREEARRSWSEARSYADEAKDIINRTFRDRGEAAPTDEETEALAQREVSRIINEELAIQAASATEVETETARRLQPLAPWLPPNPRQIKRILNGVALYHAVALNHPTFSTAGDRWFQLALWVVVMTEWPQTWRLLVTCPALADVIAAPSPAAALADLGDGSLPGSRAAVLKEVQRIRADRALTALITGSDGRPGPRLDRAAIADLLTITPPHGRPTRLAEPETPAATGGAPASAPA